MKSSNEMLDLRVRRTYKFLWDALMTLMTERDFESITVTDICENAMVHRTTFYKHYEDKYGLLYHGIHDELNALVEVMDGAGDKSVDHGHGGDTRTKLIAIFEHVRKREGFYRLMLTGESFSKFNTLLLNAVAERLERNLGHKVQYLALPMALHAQIAAAAIVRMIAWWLENNCPYTPAEMIQYFDQHIALL
jgi:AcrR family transcriptional regulator